MTDSISGRQEFEKQRDMCPSGVWIHGLDPTIRALRDFCDAAAEQGIGAVCLQAPMARQQAEDRPVDRPACPTGQATTRNAGAAR